MPNTCLHYNHHLSSFIVKPTVREELAQKVFQLFWFPIIDWLVKPIAYLILKEHCRLGPRMSATKLVGFSATIVGSVSTMWSYLMPCMWLMEIFREVVILTIWWLTTGRETFVSSYSIL
jgi:hypothetical protein